MDTLIRDNKNFGSVGDFLKEVIKEGSELSVVSAYFTIFAYYGLHEQLDSIKSMKFLFGEPTFITSDNVDVRNYKIEDESIIINPTEKFGQKRIASKCAEWIRNKVEVKSIVKPNFLHGKMYYTDLDAKGYPKAISGSSNFTTSGLGLKDKANNIELNLIVDSDRQKDELKGWFDDIWNDTTGLVQDVKEEVLKYLELLYKENEPELVYFKTLYSIFKDYLDEQKDNKLFDETAFKDTVVWNKLYEFQKDGVKGAINKLDSKLSKSKINRFVSISKSDCFTLCKNLNIYVTERFDLEVLKKQTSNADKKLGSLKRLELLLSQKDGNVHNIISPLFIIYDMRIVDSHDVDEDNSVFDRLGIKLTGNEENYVVIGATIIYLLAKCLHELAEIINK